MGVGYLSTVVFTEVPRRVISCTCRSSLNATRDLLVVVSINVQSLSPSTLDNLLVEVRERSLDVLLLCETWHDGDSVSIRRLRAEGFRVIERARPRSRRAEAQLTVNHGGVAIFAAAGVRLTSVDVGVQPATFECVAGRLTSGTSSCVVVVVYRRGSWAVTSEFFTELADMLDRLSTFVDPLVLAGDVNIRFDRPSDPHAVSLSPATVSRSTYVK